MKPSTLKRAFSAAILAGSPLALGSCLGQSSCPDDGHEPPVAELVSIEAGVVPDGPLDVDGCNTVCASVASGETVTCLRESGDSAFCIARPFPCEGRRPAGLESAIARPARGLDCHLADAAWLEAASVDAFRLLRRELRAHGAPRSLLRAVSRGARDERRHARATRALARRFGVAVPQVERTATEPRSLFELAVENGVEGCVRETWGALVALNQAKRAEDPEVCAAMGPIARDEMRHAHLAWRIDHWLKPRLTEAQRRELFHARAAAISALEIELAYELDATDRKRLGLPSSHEARLMLAELDRSIGLSGTV